MACVFWFWLHFTGLVCAAIICGECVCVCVCEGDDGDGCFSFLTSFLLTGSVGVRSAFLVITCGAEGCRLEPWGIWFQRGPQTLGQCCWCCWRLSSVSLVLHFIRFIIDFQQCVLQFQQGKRRHIVKHPLMLPSFWKNKDVLPAPWPWTWNSPITLPVLNGDEWESFQGILPASHLCPLPLKNLPLPPSAKVQNIATTHIQINLSKQQS